MRERLAHVVPSGRAAEIVYERFEVLEELGEGGFGRVLLCKDRESGELTAIKELRRFGADALLRFKKEFRLLADMHHPNLVRLGELFEGSGRWAFSLEYVPGHDALSWVRTGMYARGFDERKLRHLLTELLGTLSVLHAAGLLHRDIKPENIRVGQDERVVLLDFGLATHFVGGRQTSEAAAIGTIAYMAPELAESGQATPAADLYAVGVLLYEALVGGLPYEGSHVHILLAKQQGLLPARPAELADGVPLDLDVLCMKLLATRPEDRPTCEAALAMLQHCAPLRRETSTRSLPGHQLFVGRQAELRELRTRDEQMQREGFRIVLIEGESGIGKTALVQRFASDLAAEDGHVLVLSGKCHPAEQVGYKAFDGVVDELSRYLKGLSALECAALLPVDGHLLSALFPVLDSVPAIGRARRPAGNEPKERFPRFDAFLELLVRLSRVRHVVLIIDDLQWTDEASLVLLRFFLDTPRAPRLLIVGTVRPLATLDDAIGGGLRELALHERASCMQVHELNEADTRALAARLLGQPEDGPQVAKLMNESGGHPLFVAELVRHIRESTGTAPAQGLDSALLARIGMLAELERTVLELSCVSGGPLPTSVLRAALGEHSARLRDVLGALRIERFLHALRRDETVVYHDRVREAVLRTLSPDAIKRHHRQLAAAWERADVPELARVAQHWLGCGHHERAAPWIERAAKKAEAASAFERAVEHYQTLLGLEGVERSAVETGALKLAFSEALASAGRYAESARVLLGALEGAREQEAPELAIRAAQRLLQAAQVNEGLAAAERAFGLLDMAWPRTRGQTVARLLWNRAWIALRGAKAPEGGSGRATLQELAQLDAMRRLAVPVVWADFLRSVEIVSRHARLSLTLREPDHSAYALSGEATMRAMQNVPPPSVAEVANGAEPVEASSPELAAYQAFAQGVASLFSGHYTRAESRLVASERLYRTHCPGAAWELSNVRGPLLNAWHDQGKIRQHAEYAQRWVDEAALRSDRFALATYAVAGLGAHRHLRGDAPERALVEIASAMAPWRSDSLGMQHWMEAIATIHVLNYRAGEGTEEFWAERWHALEHSFLYRLPYMRESLAAWRLGSTLALATMAPSPELMLREARRRSRGLDRAQSPFGAALGAFYCAQLAWLERDLSRAQVLARVALTKFQQMGAGLYVRYAEVLAARAEAAEDVRDHEQRTLDWLASEGFINTERALYWWLPVARTWR